MRRIAFCFHHAEASGASLWLQKFLLNNPWPASEAIAIFPGPSPMGGALQQAGFECLDVPIEQVSISGQGVARKLRLAGQRANAVRLYRNLFTRHRIDVVYVNSSVQIAPMLAARSLGLRLVVHVREGWRSGATFPLKRWAVRTLANAALFDAQLGMRIFGGEPAGRRWLFSPNGVAPHEFDATRRERTRQALGLEPRQQCFLFLGSLVQRKGVHDLSECWPRIAAANPNVQLLLGGLEERSETHPAIARIIRGEVTNSRFLGFRSDVYDLLEAADFFILPSYGEAMPISICESMMVGTPVIARTAGDVEWLLRDGRGYPFSGDGAETLEETVRIALADPDRKAKAAAARVFAQEHLHRNVQQRQIVELLQTV